MSKVTEQEVKASQEAWAQAVIAIGKAFDEQGDYAGVAKEQIAKLYGYHLGPVAFKPTLASENAFRSTPEGALSYFVANNPEFPEDKGFAIRPWTAVRFDENTLILQESGALSMGNYYFTDKEGNDTKVEYSFGYFRAPTGELLINLHHSSMPYSA